MAREAIEPGRDESVHAVLAEYLHQIESGQTPDEKSFVSKHAEFAQELRQFLADNAWFDAMAEPLQTWRGAPAGNATQRASPATPAADDIPPTTSTGVDAAAPHPRTRRFGNYELLEEIGCGGMGVVYRAKQHNLKRVVALKMILSGHFASRQEIDRFHRGAEAAAHLQRQNIVQIHEVGEHEGVHYFTMDYVQGKSLAERVQAEGPLPPKQAARYIEKTAEAIHYAHQQGTYHRDLKPANVLIDETDEPRITDFGLAKRLDDDPEMTKETDFFGTSSYMPPEQAARRWNYVRPPRHSNFLGATLYHLLTGRPPFREENLADTVLQVIHSDPIPPRDFNPKIPRDLEAVVLMCLEKSPRRRYATAAALAEDLGRFLKGEPVRARPRGRLVRSLHWARGVPLVARLTGRVCNKPTASQRWGQRAINSFCLVALLAIAVTFLWPIAFPKPIRLLGGLPGPIYIYNEILTLFAPRLKDNLGRSVMIVPSGGSNENVPALQKGKADLALTHLGAKSLIEEGVTVVAPMCYGVVYVVVREKSGIKDFSQLHGKKISLGPPSLGMRDAAATVLQSHGIAVKEEKADLPFESIVRDETMDGAIVTTALGHPYLEKLLPGGFKVLSLPEAGNLAHQDRHRFQLVEVTLSSGKKIATVQSPIVLAARAGTPAWLITAALESLYQQDGAPLLPYLMSREEAANWAKKLPLGMHPAARDYFKISASSALSP